MASWRARRVEILGALWYRDAEPPGPEAFAALGREGFAVETVPADPAAAAGAAGGAAGAWALSLAKPGLGELVLGGMGRAAAPPTAMATAQPMARAEREAAAAARSFVLARADPPGADLLAERKAFLRLAAAAAAATGAVAVADMAAARLWSPSDLADELAHEGPLDLEHVMAVHRVVEREDGEPVWVHTEGLAALGIPDIDIAPSAPGRPFWDDAEAPRTVAALMLEGLMRPGGPAFPVFTPGGACRLVPLAEFLARGRGHGADTLRRLYAESGDGHGRDRVVLCEPEKGGLGRLLGGGRPEAFAALWTDAPWPAMAHFTSDMTRLMAARARATFPAFRALHAEFADLEFGFLAKLAVPVRVAGDPAAVEHMWFEVHGFDASGMDATLAVEPFAPCDLRRGDRGRRGAAGLGDWLVATPFGQITPRRRTVLHFLRENRNEIAAMLQAAGGR